MKKIIDKPWNYTLYQTENKYTLSVLCGGVGMYEIEIELNKEEADSYKEKGESYIDILAKEIQENTNQWIHRKVNT
jgi:hypothetical protein